VALIAVFLCLRLTYSEDFGSASRADTLGRRTLVLHGDSFLILDLNLLSALHTIRLHLNLPLPRFVIESSTRMLNSQ
jgi:hypothetical protein